MHCMSFTSLRVTNGTISECQSNPTVPPRLGLGDPIDVSQSLTVFIKLGAARNQSKLVIMRCLGYQECGAATSSRLD